MVMMVFAVFVLIARFDGSERDKLGTKTLVGSVQLTRVNRRETLLNRQGVRLNQTFGRVE